MYIENIKMDNSLKWVSFNVVSGQMTSNALWKLGEVLLIHFFFYSSEPLQIFPYKLLW